MCIAISQRDIFEGERHLVMGPGSTVPYNVELDNQSGYIQTIAETIRKCTPDLPPLAEIDPRMANLRPVDQKALGRNERLSRGGFATLLFRIQEIFLLIVTCGRYINHSKQMDEAISVFLHAKEFKLDDTRFLFSEKTGPSRSYWQEVVALRAKFAIKLHQVNKSAGRDLTAFARPFFDMCRNWTSESVNQYPPANFIEYDALRTDPINDNNLPGMIDSLHEQFEEELISCLRKNDVLEENG